MYGKENGGGKKTRLRVRKNEEANVSELKKQGYQLVKDRRGRQVWEKESSSGSEIKSASTAMQRSPFVRVAEKSGTTFKYMPEKSTGGTGAEDQSGKAKSAVVLKTKKQKETSGGSFAEKIFGPRENWIGSGKGSEQRQLDRQSRKNCRIGQGCYVGKKQ